MLFSVFLKQVIICIILALRVSDAIPQDPLQVHHSQIRNKSL